MRTDESNMISLALSQLGVLVSGLVLALVLLSVAARFVIPGQDRMSRAGRWVSFWTPPARRLWILPLKSKRLRREPYSRRLRLPRIRTDFDNLISEAQTKLTAVEKQAPEETARARPDLETRTAALVSLEGIAQDAVRRGLGRSHIRVMKILCSYVRENAPASLAVAFPLQDWMPLSSDAHPIEKKQHLDWRAARFASPVNSNVRDWAASLQAPREDVALALRIIGRRTADQRAVEAVSGRKPKVSDIRVYDTPCPTLDDAGATGPYGSQKVARFLTDLKRWRDALGAYQGYRPDLRRTNLQAADVSDLDLSGCRLDRARFEGACLAGTRLVGASLQHARLGAADCNSVQMQGADLSCAWLEGADFRNGKLDGAIFPAAQLEWVNFKSASLRGADFTGARMEITSMYGSQLQGTVFRHANLSGAVLRDAQMEEAEFWEADLSWANLRGARMERTNLCWATLQGADLGSAFFDGAQLNGAILEAADLRSAKLEATALRSTQLAGITSADRASFRRSLLKDVDLSDVPLSQSQIDQCFGDASVIPPNGCRRPSHWPTEVLPVYAKGGITDHWQKWCHSASSDRPGAGSQK
ncbi:pentapeptide repeat-containing protein [Marivita sp. XM-24bin2]|jgi:uncharacterized protein YjbI with pentapeptide repeats|uniref:pentapeptide repeat-containing protein n=2 Tax=unclassified Marivita TaxID=2632480 RepID=UPI0025BCC8C4|nr:pentapeptide repeat-containing protein [Marivita sp. XM-24bin2]